MIGYKFTNREGVTRAGCDNALWWSEGVTHKVRKHRNYASKKLCTPSWIHYYQHHVQACLMDPAQGHYIDFLQSGYKGQHTLSNFPPLWRVRTGRVVVCELTKCGARSITTLCRIPRPEVYISDLHRLLDAFDSKPRRWKKDIASLPANMLSIWNLTEASRFCIASMLVDTLSTYPITTSEALACYESIWPTEGLL